MLVPELSETSSQGLSAPNWNTNRLWGWGWVINMDLEAPSTRIRIFLKAEPFFPFQAIPPPPFFFPFSVECVSWYWVDRSDWKKKNLKNKITRFGGRPGTPASLLWSLETTRHEPKINMAEKLVDVIVELTGAPNDNFRKISVRKTILRSRIFGTFVVKFLACLPLLGFRTSKLIGIIAHFYP